MSTTTLRVRPLVGAVATERQILTRADRAVGIGEGKLRYQLEHKYDSPLAGSRELLDALAELDELGLITSELCFRLTTAGRVRLAELAGGLS